MAPLRKVRYIQTVYNLPRQPRDRRSEFQDEEPPARVESVFSPDLSSRRERVSVANAMTQAKGRATAKAGDAGTSQVSGRSLSDHAYHRLMDMIVHRQLSGGEVLVESRLADSLGLTRTPLREALVRLEGEGLLVKQANRSFAVRSVRVSEFFQSLRVREYLESQAAALAAKRVAIREIEGLRKRIARLAKTKAQSPEHWKLDNDLHNWLARSSGNAVLAEVVRKLRITTQLFEIGQPFDRVRADASEHLAILQALERGDPESAQLSVVSHLRNIETDVLHIVSSR